MSVPVNNRVVLGDRAVNSLAQHEQTRPFVAGLTVLSVLSLLGPDLLVAASVACAAIVLLAHWRSGRAAYRFVGCPSPAAYHRAESWSVALFSALLVAYPLQAMILLADLIAAF